jgi:hypothetical protein
LTTTSPFNWLETGGQVVIYPRESTALVLTSWGTIERRVWVDVTILSPSGETVPYSLDGETPGNPR